MVFPGFFFCAGGRRAGEPLKICAKCFQENREDLCLLVYVHVSARVCVCARGPPISITSARRLAICKQHLQIHPANVNPNLCELYLANFVYRSNQNNETTATPWHTQINYDGCLHINCSYWWRHSFHQSEWLAGWFQSAQWLACTMSSSARLALLIEPRLSPGEHTARRAHNMFICAVGKGRQSSMQNRWKFQIAHKFSFECSFICHTHDTQTRWYTQSNSPSVVALPLSPIMWRA